MNKTTTSLRRDFSNRQQLIDYLRLEFGGVVSDSQPAPVIGGRKAGLALLDQLDPKLYARSRNFLDGRVSQLSPYLRHGVLTLAEVRDHALSVALPHEAEKFLSELGWRDYWQRLYRLLGHRIWNDLEKPKTGHAARAYAQEIPPEVEQADTGLACMDAFSQQLTERGSLHNHARMWLAAYLVHWLKVSWQAGARWFLRHLLDGDPASNNLSWQWVAGTFSHKPYFFNRENLQRFSANRFCSHCRLRDACPLEGSYEQLSSRLFPHLLSGQGGPPLRAQPARLPPPPVAALPSLFWMHGDGLRQASSAPAVFVFDDAVLRYYQISFKRLLFMYECLLELEVEILRGRPLLVILSRMESSGAQQILTTDSPSPGFARLRHELEKSYPLGLLQDPPFAQEPAQALDLTRFSRYWQRVQKSASQPTSLTPPGNNLRSDPC